MVIDEWCESFLGMVWLGVSGVEVGNVMLEEMRSDVREDEEEERQEMI